MDQFHYTHTKARSQCLKNLFELRLNESIVGDDDGMFEKGSVYLLGCPMSRSSITENPQYTIHDITSLSPWPDLSLSSKRLTGLGIDGRMAPHCSSVKSMMMADYP
jgi:hypothetical protein